MRVSARDQVGGRAFARGGMKETVNRPSLRPPTKMRVFSTACLEGLGWCSKETRRWDWNDLVSDLCSILVACYWNTYIVMQSPRISAPEAHIAVIR